MAKTNKIIQPVLPLRDIVVFPNMIVRLFVGREKSVRALEEVMKENKEILLVSQVDATQDEPTEETINKIGVSANVLQILKLPDGAVKILVEGKNRVKIEKFTQNKNFFEAEATILSDTINKSEEIEALRRSIIGEFDRYSKLNKNIPEEALKAITEADSPSKLADTVAGHLSVSVEKKQELLEIIDLRKRLETIFSIMQGEMSVLRVEKKIKSRVKNQMERTQREYYLNEQMKAIQKELGDGSETQDELVELEEKISKIKLSKEAKDKALAELKKLKSMSPMSAEATVVRNYLDWILSIPWGKQSRVKKDLNRAQKTLDDDHCGLEKVKERIVEYLAIQQRSKKIKGPILCLVGPPGVGKTSLGKSIAKSMGREFVRISLGGVRDEAEIRGHRRTYIGALPGRIIQSLKKAKTNNPVFMLDEIDKLGSDFRGDPSSAMLEVLDPEQNHAFSDHYLEVDFDLSKVMFISTANYPDNIPHALYDRMEMLDFRGYIDDEKVKIAEKHLIPKQIKENGLTPKQVKFNESGIKEVIRSYTRESGVRSLEREISNVLRKIAVDVVNKKLKTVTVSKKIVNDYLGIPKFQSDLAERTTKPGVVTGMAWTAAGGDILFVESSKMKGKGILTLTGQLGDVMKESAAAAFTYVKAHTDILGLKEDFAEKMDIHVHCPAGAIPKDGPSAGVGMFTSLVSLLTNKPVKSKLSMTGEITLRGNVLAIGGVKEKVTAAHRAGIKTIVLPFANKRDLEEIPEHIKKDLTFHFAKELMDVIDVAIPDLKK